MVFILARFMEAIAFVLGTLLSLCLVFVIARAVLSWVVRDPYHPAARFLSSVTDPVFDRVRRRVPIRYSGFDFTPFIVMLIILFLQRFLVQSLEDLSQRLLVSSPPRQVDSY